MDKLIAQRPIDEVFPYASVEPITRSRTDIFTRWCKVSLYEDHWHLYEASSSPEYLEYVFDGHNWELRLIDKVVEFESTSSFYLLGGREDRDTLIHTLRTRYVEKVGALKSVKLQSWEGAPICWRGWNGHLIRCSVPFHLKYVW